AGVTAAAQKGERRGRVFGRIVGRADQRDRARIEQLLPQRGGSSEAIRFPGQPGGRSLSSSSQPAYDSAVGSAHAGELRNRDTSSRIYLRYVLARAHMKKIASFMSRNPPCVVAGILLALAVMRPSVAESREPSATCVAQAAGEATGKIF